jgi:predicted nucleic acid-binding Zn ribbon protein
MQRMADDPVSTCEVCGASVQRVFHPIAVHFKGSGFYNTDYGKKKTGASTGSSADGSPPKSDSSGGSDSKSDSKKSSDSKSSSSKSSSSSSD